MALHGGLPALLEHARLDQGPHLGEVVGRLVRVLDQPAPFLLGVGAVGAELRLDLGLVLLLALCRFGLELGQVLLPGLLVQPPALLQVAGVVALQRLPLGLAQPV